MNTPPIVVFVAPDSPAAHDIVCELIAMMYPPVITNGRPPDYRHLFN